MWNWSGAWICGAWPRSANSTRRACGIAAAAALTLALTACSGDDSSGAAADERSPEDVVAAAATNLTDTSGVQLALRTDDLPDGINGIQKAVGVATDAPAFEGTLTVLLDQAAASKL